MGTDSSLMNLVSHPREMLTALMVNMVLTNHPRNSGGSGSCFQRRNKLLAAMTAE